MKKYLLLFVIVFGLNTLQAQDNFTYKKIKSTNVEKEELSVIGAASNSSSIEDDQINVTNSSGPLSEISETRGDISVSLTGGASYNVPIAVPAGINNIKPTLAIAYSSQGGNGLAGYGWNISGISVISRTASTKFHDNNIDPVDFDNLDRFVLDGQRLILKSGTHGTSGAVYETENYSNLKITLHGTSPYGAAYGPLYFRIAYPDGSLAYYGASSSSRSRNDYAISSWQTVKGVRIDYTYVSSNNGLSISSIKYGGRSSSTHMNEVKFIYGNRKRPEQSYVGGIGFIRKNLLKQIQILGNGIGYRNYVLSHNYTTLGYDRLISIQEKSGDNSLSHTPIYFNYSNTSSSIYSNNLTYSLGVNNIEQRNAEVSSLDLTGNGKMDFVVHPKTSSQRNKFWVFKEIQSSNTNYAYEVNTGRFESLFPVSWLTHNNKILSGQGIAIIQNSGASQVKFKVYSNGFTNPIYYQYEKTWNAPTYNNSYSCGSSNTSRIPQEYVSGDFNGDGLSDVIAIGKSYSYSYCYETTPPPGQPCGFLDPIDGDPILFGIQQTQQTLNNKINTNEEASLIGPIGIGGGGTCCECSSSTNTSSRVNFINLDRRLGNSNFTNSAGYLSGGYRNGDNLLTADINGDGKTDIIHVKAGRVYIYSLDNNNYLRLLWQTSDSQISLDRPLLLGDYNGDGKTDFMTPTANNSYTFAMFLSTGSSFNKRTISQPFQYKEIDYNGSSATLYGYNLLPVDMNGDGRTDIIDYRTTTYNNSSSGNQTVRIYNNTFSSSSIATPKFSYGGYSSRTGNLKHFPIPVFISSDKPNSNLDFASISNSWVSSFSFSKDHREDVLLRSVNNNGVTHSIRYNALNENETGLDYTPVYQRASNRTYPYVDIEIAPGTKVVSAIQRIRSGTTTLKQTFSYYGAVTNMEGLGFQGFQGVARSNWHTGNSDRMYTITKHNPNLRGSIELDYLIPYSINFYSVPSDYINKNTYTYQSSLSSSKVFKLKNTNIISENRRDGTTTTKSFIYDSYNNPTKITTNYSGQGSIVLDYNYANNPSGNASSYYIGRPTKKIETNTIGGNSFTTEERYTYSSNLLSERRYKGHGTQFNSERFYYDIVGNLTRRVTAPYGEASREVSFKYESSYRFLTESKDIEGMTTKYSYNLNNGTLYRDTNPFNQNTYYYYDAWFRQTRTQDYRYKQVNTSYSESSNSYTITVSGDDGSNMISVYDPLKRLILEKEKNTLGQWISKSYVYDKFDRIWKESEPYTGSAANQWNTTEYDFHGRIKKRTHYTGRVVNYTYSGLAITINDGTKTVTTTKDALGNKIRIQDPGGTVNYTYFGNGNLKTTNYGGVVASIQQDGWGRKTKLTDPSAGVFNYEYNGFGEVTKETTPKGSTTYTYSSVGKLQQEKITGDHTNMTINYSYNPTSKLPTNISLTNADGNNSTYVYAYDSHKRVTSLTENTPYARFIKRYTYDDFSRIVTEELEARALANNKYSKKKFANFYQNGGLRSIRDHATNKTLWSVNGINARGQVTSTSVGEGIITNNTYNTNGYLTKKDVNKVTLAIGSGGGVQDLMELTYNFNAQRRILNSRSNSLFNWNETFQYDNLDRLTSFNDNTGNKTHTYDTRGRITANSILGNYAYSGNSYKQSELTLNTAGNNYYNNYQAQQITYNALKKPVEISEGGKDKISFQYNAFKSRANIFYGGTQSDKLQRRYRKHYSHDGSMEITYDKQTGKTNFVSYIGGDGYSAQVIWYSDQGASRTDEYYNLHRDYLGSIIMITDKTGNIKEKRHFDAWGKVVKLQDSNNTNLSSFKILDRGYTGHEHLTGVGIVHMNGRLYSPVLHRFLSTDNNIQDPYNTQNFNRYAYVLNNPLSFNDPSGEFLFTAFLVGALIGALAGAAGYIASALKTGTWNFAQFGLSILGGALVGGISGGIAASVTTVTTSAIIKAVAEAFVVGFLPSFNVSIGNWNFGISPSVAFGTGAGKGVFGISGSVGYSDGKNFAFSISGTARKGASSIGGGISVSKNGQSLSLGATFYGAGNTDNQSIWYVGYKKGDFSFTMTNDAWLSGDKFRTAAAEVGIGDYSVGMNLYTTAPPKDEAQAGIGESDDETFKSLWGPNQGRKGPDKGTYSSGSRVFAGLYIGVRNGNHVQRLGIDAPFVQDFFQNGIHRHIVRSPYFNTNLGSGPSLFTQNFTFSPWTLYSN